MENKKNNLDCFQLVYDWYAEKNNINIHMHFLSKWYSLDEQAFDNRINTSHKLLEKFHGIKFSKIQKISEHTNFTIQVVCDGYNCEWAEMYLKKHTAHSFVIVPDKNNLLTLIDPYSMLELSKLPSTFIENKEISMYDISFTSATSSDYIGEVVKIAKDKIESKPLLKMVALLKNINERSLDYNGIEFQYDPRLIFVKQISNKYANIHYCFTEISKIYRNFSSVCVFSAELMKKSRILCDLTIKSYIKKDGNISVLKDIMYSLIQTEEEMINFIVQQFS